MADGSFWNLERENKLFVKMNGWMKKNKFIKKKNQMTGVGSTNMYL